MGEDLIILPGLEGFVYKGPTYLELNEKLKSNPLVYNLIQQNIARRNNPTKEIVSYKDSNGNTLHTTNVSAGVLSPVDPLAELYVAGKVLDPAFKLVERAGEYGMARLGNNWARARILSRNINNVVNNTLYLRYPINLRLLERRPSRISEAERLGIPRGERNQPFKAKVPNITSENTSSITPEQWTAAQDAAIARGDMAEAQRLRDLHFKVSAPNTKVKEAVFNGSLSDKPFYEFNTNFRNAYWGGRDDYTTGAWFGTGDENTLLSFAGDNPNRLKKFYLNFSNPFIKDAGYRRWDKLLPFNMTEEDIAIEAAKLREKGFPEYVIEDWKNGLKTTTDNYALKLETTDYDSGIIKNVYENKAHPDSEYGVITDYIASKPNQIKSADAVTYDNNGVRIPLGKRDNFKLSDIRYSWLLPFLAVSAASYKQGGKMNILQFLKNGSGIHIKKENRGKFTDYCGGKVTSECIAKGKRSPNPAIRKRATFADNARHFKHRLGGSIVEAFKLRRLILSSLNNMIND